MKLIPKMLALALVALVGLVSVYAEPVTSSWWTVNFSDHYTNGGLITNSPTQANGVWTSTGDDASIMTNDTVALRTGNMGRLDTTEDGSLVWTPNQGDKGDGMTKVLLDIDVYMIGTEDAPRASDGTVQTVVYLKNVVVSEAMTSVLCAHVGDGVGTKWVQLSHAEVELADGSWVDLRIEINYDAMIPQVAFYVDDKQLSDGSNAWFDVMPTGAQQDTITDVTFTGTGYFDNFVGQGVAAGTTFPTSTDTGGTPGTGGSIDDGTPGEVTATFVTDTKYIRMTGPRDFVRTARVDGGVATFSTTDLAPGTYSIVAYYGELSPTVIPPAYTPAAEASGENKAAEVVAENITLNVVPVSGLYYTLFAGKTVNGLKAAAGSTLAMPADEDAGFLQITMPVPTEANEVKIIKIVASDESYILGDDIPVQ